MWLWRRGCAEERRRLGWWERGVSVECQMGNIILRGPVEEGSAPQFGLWMRVAMICEPERAVVAK